MVSSDISTASPRKLEGKVAIITGGASGIGESTARLFVHHNNRTRITSCEFDRAEVRNAEKGGNRN
ncbi:unnamed protein product [Linum tenue]|uniref:Uncharacterized protein n=1 Tax=Linum tenue TaxID=586396 RepID=A0AAV0I629_9ROSI|nr:unnamed protein product [Linum tenue]CAI0391656.1 unnamed protein product [Linum tenue]